MTKKDERTERIYLYIKSFVEREGYPPSLREIAAACEVGVSTAMYQVELLEAEGVIARRRGRNRGMKLIMDASFRPAPRKRARYNGKR
jgi:repressor LexA